MAENKRQESVRRVRRSGIACVISGPLFVAVVYFGLHAWNQFQADTAMAPDQTSMVFMFLLLIVGCGIGFLIIAIGVGMIAFDLNSPQSSEREL